MYEYDFHDRIDWEAPEIELDISVILEGPFNGVDMLTSLNDLDSIPLSQPYNIPPWDYPGTETVGMIPNADVVDWILIELRDAVNGPSALPATIIEQQAVFILDDGSLVRLDGYSNPTFNSVPIDHLFLVIKHRNHLGIMTAIPITESGGLYDYDFTTGAGQAYNSGQKHLGGGIYGMFAADEDANGVVDIIDKTSWANDAGKYGYQSADYNIDGQVNNVDKNDYWGPNQGSGSFIPE